MQDQTTARPGSEAELVAGSLDQHPSVPIKFQTQWICWKFGKLHQEAINSEPQTSRIKQTYMLTPVSSFEAKWAPIHFSCSAPRTCKWNVQADLMKGKLPSLPFIYLQISVKQSWHHSSAVKRKSHCLSSAAISMASSGSFQEWTSKVRLMEVAHFKNGKQSSFDNARYLLWANPVFHNKSAKSETCEGVP